MPKYFTPDKASVASDIWNKTLTINRGESYLIKANSGRGKSSLCNFLYGVRNDYSGEIVFDTKNIDKFTIDRWIELRKRSLSILFQDLRLFDELTVIQNIELKNRLTNHKRVKEIVSLLERLGIGSKVDSRVSELSLGERQRVAFVRTVIQPFDFIILDEPVSHLDSDNGAVMAQILTEESQKEGAGVIVTSVGNNLQMQYDNIVCL